MMTLLLHKTLANLIGTWPVTNLLWFSLGSIVAIPPYVIVFSLLSREKELLNRLLEKNGIPAIGDEVREKPITPEMPKRKMSFPMKFPNI